MLIVNKTMNEVGFIIEDYNGFTEHKEEELAKLLKNLKVTLLFISGYGFMKPNTYSRNRFFPAIFSGIQISIHYIQF